MFTLYFSKENKRTGKIEQEAIVHITLDRNGLDTVKIDVDLNSLPDVSIDGYEVVAHFSAHNF